MGRNQKIMVVLTVLSVIIATIPLVVSLASFLREEESRSLDLISLSDSQVVRQDDSVSERIEVFFDDAIVPDLWVGTYRLENTGTEPITRSDFDQPIYLSLSHGRLLGLALNSDSSSKQLNAEIALGEDQVVSISEALFNPGQHLVFSIFATTALTDNVFVDANIAGVESVNITTAPVGDSDQVVSSRTSVLVALIGLMVGFEAMLSSVISPVLFARISPTADVDRIRRRRRTSSVMGVLGAAIVYAVILAIAVSTDALGVIGL